MRKLYLFALYSQHQQNYVYETVFCKNVRHAVFKYCQLLDKGKVIKKCRLHLIGEAYFGSGGKLINVTRYLVPKEVHLTKFGKIVSLCDYFTWKFKEVLCQKFQQILKKFSITFQKMRPLTQFASE